MSSEWLQTNWGEIVTLNYGKAIRDYQSASGEYPVYGTNGPIGWHHAALCRTPGVIVGRKGAYRGIHYCDRPFFVIDTAFFVSPKVDLDLRWAYYCLLTYDINGMDSGSAIPSTSRDEFYKLPVVLPSKVEQVEIAKTLALFDDRITLLRETNATLEAIAQALFKSWFVDFDPVRAKMDGRVSEGMDESTAALFPDVLEESELGLVPRGWRVDTIENVAERVGMGPFGSNIKVETFVQNGIPVISGQHLKQTLVEDNTFNFVTEEHATRLAKSCVQPGDVIFTHAGSIGQVSMLHASSRFERYVLSQRQFFLRCDPEVVKPEWAIYFFRSPIGQHLLLANASQV